MVDRRRFLTGAAATLLAGRKALGAPERKAERKDNLIPSQPGKAPNYWCTWAAQNYMYGHHLPQLDPSILEGDSEGRAGTRSNRRTTTIRDQWLGEIVLPAGSKRRLFAAR